MCFCKLPERRKMSINRIKAVLIQEFFITMRSMEVILDIFFFPAMSIVLFGFLSSYLSGTSGSFLGQSVLMGTLLWEIVFITQYSVSVGSLWNIWSRNLSNMFISPLTTFEYIFAHILSGVTKATFVFLLTSVVSIFAFNFNIFDLGAFNLFLFCFNLALFAIGVGLAILGMIFCYGTKIQAFAWGLLPIVQPLTAALYPVQTLPTPIKEIAYIFPPTYVFEAARQVLTTGRFDWNNILIAFGLNLIWITGGALLFKSLFRKSRISGQFARNES